MIHSPDVARRRARTNRGGRGHTELRFQLTPYGQQMVAANIRLVYHTVRLFCRRYDVHPSVWDEAESIAHLRFCRAVASFNACLGFRLSTYCRPAMWRALRQWHSRRAVRVAYEVDESLSPLHQFADDEPQADHGETVSDDLTQAIARLHPEIAEVVTRYYLKGELLRTIAQDKGVTRSRIQQRAAMGIERLRWLLRIGRPDTSACGSPASSASRCIDAPSACTVIRSPFARGTMAVRMIVGALSAQEVARRLHLTEASVHRLAQLGKLTIHTTETGDVFDPRQVAALVAPKGGQRS